MPDVFEKKTDKHYTYKCRENVGANSERNIGWVVFCAEHEPGKAPPFGQQSYNIANRLSQSAAEAKVLELQAEEMKRREEIEQQYPDIKSKADAAKRQVAVAEIKKLNVKREELVVKIQRIDEAINRNKEVIEVVDKAD